MEDVRAGLMMRTIRRRRRLTQSALGLRVGLSRETISRLERGAAETATVRTLREISRALQMPPIVSLGWRGAEVAALLDERHAALVERVVGSLRMASWDALVEYSFSHYGERGSVDVVGWRGEDGALLLVEVKSRIVDLQELFRSLDRKRRLVPSLLATDKGWAAKRLGVVLAVPETSAIRRAVGRHAASFQTVLPDRTVDLRRWLLAPDGDLRAIWFLSDSLRA